jgi:beta-glucosidase/6-phospho-beta-glucosidase/beta-galactosidase
MTITLPAHPEAAGGWLAPDTTDRFADDDSAAARHFGDQVASFAILNEPCCST